MTYLEDVKRQLENCVDDLAKNGFCVKFFFEFCWFKFLRKSLRQNIEKIYQQIAASKTSVLQYLDTCEKKEDQKLKKNLKQCDGLFRIFFSDNLSQSGFVFLKDEIKNVKKCENECMDLVKKLSLSEVEERKKKIGTKVRQVSPKIRIRSMIFINIHV